MTSYLSSDRLPQQNKVAQANHQLAPRMAAAGATKMYRPLLTELRCGNHYNILRISYLYYTISSKTFYTDGDSVELPFVPRARLREGPSYRKFR